jgi:hypothetical protein
MARPRRKQPPQDATTEQLREWVARELQRERDREANGRSTGADRRRGEDRDVRLQAFSEEAAAFRAELAQQGWSPLGPDGPRAWPDED